MVPEAWKIQAASRMVQKQEEGRGRQKRRGVFREGWRWINTQRTENVVS